MEINLIELLVWIVTAFLVNVCGMIMALVTVSLIASKIFRASNRQRGRFLHSDNGGMEA